MNAVFALLAGAAASLSSCTIVRLPVVLGIASGAAGSRRRAILLTCTFSLGLMLSYTLLGVTFGAAVSFGSKLIIISKYIFRLFGVVLILSGLVVAGLLNVRYMQACGAVTNRFKRLGTAGVFFFGMVFALFEMPGCPACSSVLLMIAGMAALKGSLFYSLLIFISFAVGQSLPVLLAGCSVGFLSRIVPAVEKHETHVRFLAGNMLLASGIFFILIA